MNASGATSITLRSRCVATFSGSIMSCSASNSGRRYGSIFAMRSPGRKPEALARLDGGAGEDDAVDLVAAERRGGHRDREERLAGAGRADAERDRVAADRVDVALLVDRLRRDLRRAVAPDDVLEDLAPGDWCWSSALVTAAIVPSAISWPCSMRSDSSRTTTAAAATASASPSSVTMLPRRNRSQSTWPSSARRIVVAACRSSACGDLVGELDLAAHQRAAPPARSAETRLPSARPATCGHRGLHHLRPCPSATRRPSRRRRRRRSRAAPRRTARPAGRPR